MSSAGSLWTPTGEIALKEKDVLPITQRELIVLGHLHEFAAKYGGIQLRCTVCDSPIYGQNNDSPDNRHPSVHCKCREFRFYR